MFPPKATPVAFLKRCFKRWWVGVAPGKKRSRWQTVVGPTAVLFCSALASGQGGLEVPWVCVPVGGGPLGCCPMPAQCLSTGVSLQFKSVFSLELATDWAALIEHGKYECLGSWTWRRDLTRARNRRTIWLVSWFCLSFLHRLGKLSSCL